MFSWHIRDQDRLLQCRGHLAESAFLKRIQSKSTNATKIYFIGSVSLNLNTCIGSKSSFKVRRGGPTHSLSWTMFLSSRVIGGGIWFEAAGSPCCPPWAHIDSIQLEQSRNQLHNLSCPDLSFNLITLKSRGNKS